jgi:hypothetical protein
MFIQKLIEVSILTFGGTATKYIESCTEQTQSMNSLLFVPKPLDQTVYNIWELNKVVLRLSPTRSLFVDWLHSALGFSGQHGAGVVIGRADLLYE